MERFKHSWLASIFPVDSVKRGSNPLIVDGFFIHDIWFSRTNSLIDVAYEDLCGTICPLENCNSLAMVSLLGRLELAETILVLNMGSDAVKLGMVFGVEVVFSQ